ncbi:MAG: BCCT family transporter, partial [Pseudomonadota bacterium]
MTDAADSPSDAERSGFESKALLGLSLLIIAVIGVWGVVDPQGLGGFASASVNQYFESRGWFVMLTVTGMLALCVALAVSKYGAIRLGDDDDRPEFSTASWIAMLFAAGMGVGLLFWAVAEPLTHFNFIRGYTEDPIAA